MAEAGGASPPAAPRGSLLKVTSNYTTQGKAAPKATTGQKISFADEHGAPIAENHFVDGLHYSEQSSTVLKGGPKGCLSCSLS